MNLDKAVMKADGNLVGRIRLVFDACLHVVEQLAHRDRNLIEENPEIALAFPELSGPAPDVAEHPLVQVLDELFAEKLAAAPERPVLPVRDVLLFGFVQFAAIGECAGISSRCSFGVS